MVIMSATAEKRWCFVTGGRGFAARHLVEMLLRHEMFHVIVADLAPEIKLEPQEETGVLEAMRSGRLQYISPDIRDKAQVFTCEGAEVVFHMAAPNPRINSYQLHCSVNVQDCGSDDPGLEREMEQQFVDLLTEELKLQEAVADKHSRHMNVTLAEAKRVASQYQKEAEKCNAATETCETERERERAEILMRREKKITSMWEQRARRLGWDSE